MSKWRPNLECFKDETKYLILMIWSRDDYGEDDPTFILVAKDRDKLKQKVRLYLDNNKDTEDYLEDDEFDKYTNNLDQIIDKGCLEFNCYYVSTLHYSC